MKPKHLTFLWHNLENNTSNTVQWETRARTPQEAWDNHVKGYLIAIGSCEDPQLTMVFKGLVEVIDEWTPLRAATKEELKQSIEKQYHGK